MRLDDYSLHWLRQPVSDRQHPLSSPVIIPEQKKDPDKGRSRGQEQRLTFAAVANLETGATDVREKHRERRFRQRTHTHNTPSIYPPQLVNL